MHRGQGKKERSIAFPHCPQDELMAHVDYIMALGEQKMEGTNLVILILNYLNESILL